MRFHAKRFRTSCVPPELLNRGWGGPGMERLWLREGQLLESESTDHEHTIHGSRVVIGRFAVYMPNCPQCGVVVPVQAPRYTSPELIAVECCGSQHHVEIVSAQWKDEGSSE